MTTAQGLTWINTVIYQLVQSITELLTNTPFVRTLVFLVLLFFAIGALWKWARGRSYGN